MTRTRKVRRIYKDAVSVGVDLEAALSGLVSRLRID